MSPFDFLNSINDTKQDIMVDDIAEKKYNGFMVNRGLSYFSDTVLFANEMNRCYHLPARLQFSFLINSIRKRKRFSKWLKPTEQDSLLIVKAYYGYSNEKARSALALLSEEQIQQLKQRTNQGGQAPRRNKNSSGE